MKHLIVLGAALLAALGVFFVVAGEADDSPGLQGLGVLAVVAAFVLVVRSVRRGTQR